jgi:hypothetical protein
MTFKHNTVELTNKSFFRTQTQLFYPSLDHGQQYAGKQICRPTTDVCRVKQQFLGKQYKSTSLKGLIQRSTNGKQ